MNIKTEVEVKSTDELESAVAEELKVKDPDLEKAEAAIKAEEK